jgi:hypothetical protein
MLRAGFEPATCRLGVDNRNRSGPQQIGRRRGHGMQSDARIRTARPEGRLPHEITEPLRPATIRVVQQARQGSNPDPRGWSSRCCRLHHRPVKSGRPGSNGPPRDGAPVLCLLSYVRARRKEPPAGVEPTPRPYKGRVLAVDTTEARVETVGVEPTSSSLQARRSSG